MTVAEAKPWLPAAAGALSFVLSSAFAVTTMQSAAAKIDQLREIGYALNTTAVDAQNGVPSSEQVKDLESEVDDLKRRLQEAREPALVQSEIMRSARRAGLDVREIQPQNAGDRPTTAQQVHAYPVYRVTLRGSYAHIAEFMQAVPEQRLPARVREFRMIPDGGESDGSVLLAEITMEAFRPSLAVAGAVPLPGATTP